MKFDNFNQLNLPKLPTTFTEFNPRQIKMNYFY